jgi:hypothetical protein
VIFRLQKLKFLDSHKISDKERDDVSKESLFYDVVSFKDSGDNEQIPSRKTNDSIGSLKYTPLTENYVEKESSDPKSVYF